MISDDQPEMSNNSIKLVLSSAEDGNMRHQDDEAQDTVNINRFTSKHYDLVSAKSVIKCTYGRDSYDIIIEVDQKYEQDSLRYYICDALVTRGDSILCLPVADCIAMVVHDPVNNVNALAHLGWHASAAGLTKKLIQHLVEEFNSNPEDIQVYISPSIDAKNYIVDSPSQTSDPAWKQFLSRSDSGANLFHVDILGFNLEALKDAGVQANQIEVSPINTYESLEYSSNYYNNQNKLESADRFLLTSQLV